MCALFLPTSTFSCSCINDEQCSHHKVKSVRIQHQEFRRFILFFNFNSKKYLIITYRVLNPCVQTSVALIYGNSARILFSFWLCLKKNFQKTLRHYNVGSLCLGVSNNLMLFLLFNGDLFNRRVFNLFMFTDTKF